jgi:endonuclease YncB( thermonuclease family)
MRLDQGFLVILIIAGSYAFAFGFTARVVNIHDGDTVEVYKQGEQFKTPIDLYGIDCPEKQQYFGYAAQDAIASLVGGKTVWIDIISEERSGRLSAVITVEGKNVNETLVAKGWAWVIPDDCKLPFCDDWRRVQENASRNRIGLWTALKPQAPWEWRKRGKRELLYILPDNKTPLWRHSP